MFESREEGKKRKPIRPFGLRAQEVLAEIGINHSDVDQSKQSIPPYMIQKPHVILSLASDKKQETTPEIFKSKLREIHEIYKTYEEIYTDGSKEGEKVAAAASTPSSIHVSRLSKFSSIFSAEAKAIELALTYAVKSKENKFIIYSDSKSVLQAILHQRPKNPLVVKVIELYNKALHKGKQIVFCWVPSHIGIRGNEEADKAASEALNDDSIPQSHKVVASDLKQDITHTFDTLWQVQWEADTNNKLQQVLPIIKGNKIPHSLPRRESSIYTRLKIGHTHLTHCYLLKGEPDPPFCIGCNEIVTVKHLLTDCIDYSHIREKYYQTNDLQEILSINNYKKVISFLKESQLFHKL